MSDLPRSRMSWRDLANEALAGLLQRPGRSVLTMLGTILGIGAFVAILGLTATAGGQIDKRFTVLAATEVMVQDVGTGDTNDPSLSFTPDAADRVQRLNGVVHAGVRWTLPLRNPILSNAPGGDSTAAGGLGLVAASPEALAAMHPTMRTGRLYDAFHTSRAERVAVLGSAAAARLGVTRLDGHPAVFINGDPYTVIGIIENVRRAPEALLAVVLPATTALAAYGPPVDQRAEMIIETRIGAAQLIASQAALALRPDAPGRFKVIAPPDPQGLRGNVTSDLNALFLLLAAISLIIGAVGIANTTLVAVLERTNEIGLRRSLGARPVHIGTQFLTESTALGLLGGLIGASLGVAAVVLTAITNEWTAVLPPWTVFAAPAIGALVGLAAGVYPALRAAWIEPVEALRR
ncbi:FtsX-like permease family protein [Micromonospora sp. NPDC005205]|uniref:ABC transporter permease n=1 Tax=Micromonospora sp. NPDC005205 TaxID=3156714 RepID=UPI0033AA3C37